jgi:hypothetical protein
MSFYENKKTDEPTPDGPIARPALSQEDRIAALIEESAKRAPPQLAEFLKKAGPILVPVVSGSIYVFNIVAPIYWKIFTLIHAFLMMLPWDLLMAVLGLTLCFFGGGYCATIAACEAFYMHGWPTTKRNLELVYEDMLAMHIAQTEDDKKDEDGDGIADVKQIPASELIDRKVRVAAAAVKDPQRLANALGGLYTGWLSVQAVLRIKFARTIQVAVSCSVFVEYYVVKALMPFLSSFVGAEFVHWMPTFIKSWTKAFFVYWAWKMQEVVSAVQSSMRGGLLFSRGLLNFLNKKGFKSFVGLSLEQDSTYVDEVVGYTMAAIGFLCQWSWGFGMPFPLNIFMWPFDLLEWYIRAEVTVGGGDPTAMAAGPSAPVKRFGLF